MELGQDALDMPVDELMMGNGTEHFPEHWETRIRIVKHRQPLTPRFRTFSRLDIEHERTRKRSIWNVVVADTVPDELEDNGTRQAAAQ